jgi:hypothetical protein
VSIALHALRPLNGSLLDGLSVPLASYLCPSPAWWF